LEENQKGIKIIQNINKLLQKALKFIAIRPRSQKEIISYLQKKSPKNQEKQKLVLEELSKLGLVNDEAFVDWWLEQRETFRPKGKRVLKMELRFKGIENDLIERSLADKVNEEALAKKSALPKIPSLKDLSLIEQKKKLVGFLSRRGFDWSVIKKTLDEILEKD
jgi:regulatory protein